jgi:hypothetical protein
MITLSANGKPYKDKLIESFLWQSPLLASVSLHRDTFSNLRHRGDRYVNDYSRKGRLTQDLLETCYLDDIEAK